MKSMHQKAKLRAAIFTVVCLGAAFNSSCTNSDTETSPYEGLRLNEMQFIGSHNSYKMQPDSLMTGEMIAYEKAGGVGAPEGRPPSFERLAYGHPPIEVQLQLGIRLLEFDLHVANPGDPFDPIAKYNERFGNRRESEGAQLPSVINDGRIIVYHVRDHDFRSTCIEFSDCLSHLADWSKGNPEHLPIIIYLEAKSNGGAGLSLTADGLVEGEQGSVFGLDQWQRVESDAVEVLGRDAVFKPGEIIRDGLSLRQSITEYGWPYVDDLQGRFIFIVAGEDESKDAYANIPDPLFFTFRPMYHPDASFIIEFDAFSRNIERILESGLIACTYADYMLVEGRDNNLAKRERLFDAGAQMISTDFPFRDPRFSDYEVIFDDRTYVRQSPRTSSAQ
jgi:hypothetical protein